MRCMRPMRPPRATEEAVAACDTPSACDRREVAATSPRAKDPAGASRATSAPVAAGTTSCTALRASRPLEPLHLATGNILLFFATCLVCGGAACDRVGLWCLRPVLEHPEELGAVLRAVWGA
eukprot:9389720-Heterocapsa_arctica.AAC.2